MKGQIKSIQFSFFCLCAATGAIVLYYFLAADTGDITTNVDVFRMLMMGVSIVVGFSTGAWVSLLVWYRVLKPT